MALLAKLAWMVASDRDSMCMTLLRSKKKKSEERLVEKIGCEECLQIGEPLKTQKTDDYKRCLL